ncbi:hypothetical protein D5018_15655 [Parashewanella curva]|uniref:Uncharacterized protein n=1 Tax=Parashewanella curva TaxID=2338552 RepID=A0A3L8PTJ8_9GAMM|nr:DUF6482 family protein [Parashewanella curva]RLV58735.1 hypothetical protein D5018_15655 [Parashewanella curva]
MTAQIDEHEYRILGTLPTIIATADLSHYLVGGRDKQGKFKNIFSEDKSQPLRLASLDQAKKMFADVGVKQVMFESHTPYDEMVGLEDHGTDAYWLKI